MSVTKSLKYVVLEAIYVPDCAGYCAVFTVITATGASIRSKKIVVFLIILICLLCVTHYGNVSLSSSSKGPQAAPEVSKNDRIADL